MNGKLSKKILFITSWPNYASKTQQQRIKFPKGKLKLRIFNSRKFSQKISQPIHHLSITQPLETLHYHIRTHSRTLESIHSSFAQEASDQGLHLFKLTKNCKMLKSITIQSTAPNHPPNFCKLYEEDLIYLHELLKLHAKQLQSVQIPMIPPSFMERPNFSRFIKTFISLKKLKSLELSFEIDMQSDRIKENFIRACHVMSTGQHLPILHFSLYYKNSGMNEFCSFALSSLAIVRNLRSVVLHAQIDRNRANLQIPDRELIITEQTLSFFNNRNDLKTFRIIALKDAKIVAFLPFDQLKELNFIGIEPGYSRSLNDDNFIQMIQRLERCSKLTDLRMNIEFCPTLTDLSIRYFAESMIQNFKELKSLSFTVRSGAARGIFELCHFTMTTWSYILQIYETKGLEHLELSFNHHNLSEEHIRQFFEISPPSNLKRLRVAFSSDLVQNSLASCLSLANLRHLTELFIDLRGCRNLTSAFFEKILEFWSLDAPQNLRRLIIYDYCRLSALENSQVLDKLKAIWPHCEISLNGGSLSR